MNEFEGSWHSSKIKRFLEAGWKIYINYDPEKPNPIIPKWTVTYERSFKSALERQCDLLSVLEKSTSDSFNDLQEDKDVVIKKGDAWHQSYHQVLKDVNASSIEPKLKEIAVYDLEQAQMAYGSKAFKACIIMLGAVLEGIMLGTLRRIDVINKMQTDSDPPPLIKQLGLSDPQLADKIADKLTFEDYKNTIHHIIPELEKDKVENIQTFRNAVHPWKTVIDATVYADPDQIRAINHITSLAILSRHILNWIA